jgi:hypothetical protein
MPINSMETPPEKYHNKNPRQDTLDQIAYIRQEIAVMGGNDSEMDELNQIEQALETESIDPATARKKAQAVLDRKMDYH